MNITMCDMSPFPSENNCNSPTPGLNLRRRVNDDSTTRDVSECGGPNLVSVLSSLGSLLSSLRLQLLSCMDIPSCPACSQSLSTSITLVLAALERNRACTLELRAHLVRSQRETKVATLEDD
ncbi:hypothetical protein BDN71DRAFT_1045214 [Pleurotus eryngii]|uniref:Uncharacterized protein n=1 Tax=Pleurotus eryngii TaxID=5323 RepID=A0A9P6A695_PLEER|nr:hypothetical protein BDN71DRAFT_1045214 [Pleurotus eryngii]